MTGRNKATQNTRHTRVSSPKAPKPPKRVVAIVPAAGFGRRFLHGSNKPFFTLNGMPLLLWVLRALDAHPLVNETIPVVKPSDMGLLEELIKEYKILKVRDIAPGGAERQDSVYSALRLVRGATATTAVLIHDGARPFLSTHLITRCLEGLPGYDGCIAAVRPKDTIKEAAPSTGTVKRTLDRNRLVSVQTPQVFYLKTLKSAYRLAYEQKHYATDDAGLVERLGGSVHIVEGSYDNIKVTTAEDVAVAKAIVKRGELG